MYLCPQNDTFIHLYPIMQQKLLLWKEKILTIGVDTHYSEIKIEQIRNANQSAVLSFIYSIIGSLMVAFFVPPPYIYVPIIGSFFYFIGLFFNYKHWHGLAGSSAWFISVLLFFWLAGAYGKTSNAYLLLIIAEILAIFNFRIYNDKWLIVQIFLPILLAVITYLSHFSLFLIPVITEEQRTYIDPIMYFTVITTCGIIVWTYGNHIQNHILVMNEAKNALQEKYTELEKMNETLSKTNEELDKFVYSVSHDLRAPITSVMGLLDLCRTDKENIDLYLNLQDKSMHRLDNFINDILHYARNSRLEIVPVPLDFSRLIKDVFDSQAYSNSADDMHLDIQITGNSAIYNDEFRFTIIMANIISNAIRYRNPKAEKSFLRFEICLSSSQAELIVKDNGIGIGASHLANIFQMFYRANSKVSGSGLGLYIVKEAIHKMNGTISVSSEEGIGTIFTLQIPNLKTA